MSLVCAFEENRFAFSLHKFFAELGKMVLKMYLKCKMQNSFAKSI